MTSNSCSGSFTAGSVFKEPYYFPATNQIGLPKTLGHAIKLLACSSRDDEVLGEIQRPNKIHPARKRRSVFFQPRNNRFTKVRSKSVAIVD